MKLGEIRNILGSQERLTRESVDLSEREPIGYSIDSRSIRAGELFFAIEGENYDGHRFVEDALRRGALAAVVSSDYLSSSSTAAVGVNAGFLPVRNTLTALQELAASVRGSWSGREVANRGRDRKSTRLNSSHATLSRMPSSA